VEVTVKSKEENSIDFFLDFVQEFGLSTVLRLRVQLCKQLTWGPFFLNVLRTRVGFLRNITIFPGTYVNSITS
jgi:hypothetical protein